MTGSPCVRARLIIIPPVVNGASGIHGMPIRLIIIPPFVSGANGSPCVPARLNIYPPFCKGARKPLRAHSIAPYSAIRHQSEWKSCVPTRLIIIPPFVNCASGSPCVPTRLLIPPFVNGASKSLCLPTRLIIIPPFVNGASGCHRVPLDRSFYSTVPLRCEWKPLRAHSIDSNPIVRQRRGLKVLRAHSIYHYSTFRHR